jgi:hypothetical protein
MKSGGLSRRRGTRYLCIIGLTAVALLVVSYAVVIAALSIRRDRLSAEASERFRQLVWSAPNAREACARAEVVLASVEEPCAVRRLAYLCNDMADEYRREKPYEAGERDETAPGHTKSIRFYSVWETCVFHLVELGQSGDSGAAAELWRMHKSGRYDAGGAELLVTAISRIGEPALPFLRRKRFLGSALARQLIEAIEKGEILE